ncbi:MAG TPA: 2-dehydropantoate 2-reductase [Candidatus Acidoferrum sp.]|nr:2-dehydropantoate 2-reductase [Candidatus Acidoferrum sp.]
MEYWATAGNGPLWIDRLSDDPDIQSSSNPLLHFPMKVAVVGCGAVGSFYGAKLARAGHEVTFLLRSDYDAVRRNGVLIRSPQGDFRVRPRAARTPEEIGPSDLIVIGLKTTANEQFSRLLPPLAGPATAVLTLQNGLGNEEHLARVFPVEQVLGGLCFVCLNRLEPGVIHHIDHGQVIIGEFQRYPEPRTHDLAGAFQHAGVPCSVADNLGRAHWEKLTWNIPFNGLGVAGAAGFDAVFAGELPPGRTLGPCLTTDKLLADGDWARLVLELINEVTAAARALGFQIPDAIADEQIERTRTMGAYQASTLLDFERRQPLELESLFREPLRQAKRAGVSVPRLEALCRLLQQLDSAAR